MNDGANSIELLSKPIKPQDDMQRLLRSIRRCKGFALYFARCNLIAYRQHIVTLLKHQSPKPIIEVDLAHYESQLQQQTIDALLTTYLQECAVDAVIFVYGLEKLLPIPETVQQQRILAQLNWRRSAFARLKRLLVFWLPEYALTLLSQQAPDFVDWYSGIYEFDLPIDEKLTRLRHSRYEFNRKKLNPAYHLSRSEKQSWLRALVSLLEEAQDNTLEKIDLLNDLGQIYASMNEYAKALDAYQQALQILEPLQDKSYQYKKSYAITLGNLADNELSIGNIDRALSLLEKMSNVLDAQNDLHSRAIVLRDIARIEAYKGNAENALSLFQQKLEMMQSIGDVREQAMTLGEIAHTEMEQGNLERALSLFQKKLDMVVSLDDVRQQALTLGDIASIEMNKNNLNRALSLFKEKLQTMKALNDEREHAMTLGDIAHIELKNGNIEYALSLLQEKLTTMESLGDLRSQVKTLADIADIYRMNAEFANAQQFYEKCLSLSEQLNNLDTIIHVHWSLGNTYAQQQQWQVANLHLKTAYELNLKYGKLEGIISVGLEWGELLLQQGQQQRAREIFQRSYESLLLLGRNEQATQVKAQFLD